MSIRFCKKKMHSKFATIYVKTKLSSIKITTYLEKITPTYKVNLRNFKPLAILFQTNCHMNKLNWIKVRLNESAA